MGAKLCCLGFIKSKNAHNSPTDDNDASRRKPILKWQDLLVPLPPNLTINRLESQLPEQSLMSVPMYLRLHRFLPPHIQRRKLELVYASWEHGFSLTAFKACLSDRRASKHASVNQEVVILIRPALELPASPLRDGLGQQLHHAAAGRSPAWFTDAAEVGTPVVGAFLPTGIDFQSRKYHGSDTMFVFTNIAENNNSNNNGSGACPAPAQSASSSGDPLDGRAATAGRYGATSSNTMAAAHGSSSSLSGSTVTTNAGGSPTLSSTFAVVERPTVYTTSRSPKVNEYYVRASDGVIVFGGGGKGAAISVNEDLDTLSSSVMCPTFGSSCLLPVEKGFGPDGQSPSGVQVEGFISKAPIHTLEVWGISNYPLTLPEGFEDDDLQDLCGLQ